MISGPTLGNLTVPGTRFTSQHKFFRVETMLDQTRGKCNFCRKTFEGIAQLETHTLSILLTGQTDEFCLLVHKHVQLECLFELWANGVAPRSNILKYCHSLAKTNTLAET